MHEDERTATGRSGVGKIVALIATAALAIPGGLLVANASAAGDGETEAPASQQFIQDESTPDRERPDGRDCPEKDGESSGESSGSSDTSAEQLAL